MSERIERTEEGIDSLRNRMDADARFRRSLSGYDPQDVRAYVENVKRIFAQQSRAAKQEQEDLIAQLDSAKSDTEQEKQNRMEAEAAADRLKGADQKLTETQAKLEALHVFSDH